MEARKSLLFAACAVALSSAAWAQQKKTIPDGPPPTSKYVQEHAIDVGDVPGHQVRVYELHFVFPKDGMVIEGVQAKESTTYGMSDYTNWTGLFNTYAVYSMEDGSTIFVRAGGATQTGADGSAPTRSRIGSLVAQVASRAYVVRCVARESVLPALPA